ncbi:MAG TPA: dTDP-4-dehydrorhamnose reductase [Thermoanaerobaculia bacterium]|nr:dTDP-4-dehydrorhamnose reductase [Thermoanaerobaculia bacterium]
MRALITGAGGLVSSALASRLSDVVALKHAALDVTDRTAVDSVVDRAEPDLIVNCAVIGVDDCERDSALARRVNVDGPAHLAEAAGRCGAAIVHFSSNYVFDGRPATREPYTIEDEPHPINVYGQTKLEGERAVAERVARAFIIRTSWVYGRGKNSFLATAPARLKRGESVQAISDTWASTTYVADLAQRVLDIIARGTPGTYHVVNGGICSHETFARDAAAFAGVPNEVADRLIEVISEAEMNRMAPRPPWTPMRCLLSERLGLPPMRDWRDALLAYVAEID